MRSKCKFIRIAPLALLPALSGCEAPPPRVPAAWVHSQRHANEIAAAFAASDIPAPSVVHLGGEPARAWAIFIEAPYLPFAITALAELGLPRAPTPLGTPAGSDWLSQLFPAPSISQQSARGNSAQPLGIRASSLAQALELYDGVTAAHVQLAPASDTLATPTPTPKQPAPGKTNIIITLRTLALANPQAVTQSVREAAAAAFPELAADQLTLQLLLQPSSLPPGSPAAKAAIIAAKASGSLASSQQPTLLTRFVVPIAAIIAASLLLLLSITHRLRQLRAS